MRAWVTGAGGLIGDAFIRTSPLSAPGWDVMGLTRSKVDLTAFQNVEALFEAERPDLVIHCAAMSRSPDCEAHPEQARLLNVEVTRHLASISRDIPFVFFSTDLVFDGARGGYRETDAVAPLSVYGRTKVDAEQIVLSNPRHFVIRTSLNGGNSPTGDRGFNEQMRRVWQEGRKMKLFVDEFRSPQSAMITARAVWELAQKASPGVYHVAGSEKLSRFQIGELLARGWPGLAPVLEPGSLSEYVGAPRPPDTSLHIGKAQSCLSFRIPGFTEWLASQPPESF